MPPTGSVTDIGEKVSPWYPPRIVKKRVRLVPAPTWNCRAIFIATSTDTEPESAKNTRCRAGRGQRHEPLGQGDRRLMGQAAEHHVTHPGELGARCVVELWHGVAVDRTPPRRHRVDGVQS